MDKENYSPVINSYAAMWEEYREVTNPLAVLGVCQRILNHYFLHTAGRDPSSLRDIILGAHRHLFITKNAVGTEDNTIVPAYSSAAGTARRPPQRLRPR